MVFVIEPGHEVGLLVTWNIPVIVHGEVLNLVTVPLEQSGHVEHVSLDPAGQPQEFVYVQNPQMTYPDSSAMGCIATEQRLV